MYESSGLAARHPPRDARPFAFRRSRQVRGASLRTSLASLLTDTRHVKSSVGSVCWEDVVPRLWLLACLFIFKWYFSKGKNVSILLKSVCLFFFFLAFYAFCVLDRNLLLPRVRTRHPVLHYRRFQFSVGLAFWSLVPFQGRVCGWCELRSMLLFSIRIPSWSVPFVVKTLSCLPLGALAPLSKVR